MYLNKIWYKDASYIPFNVCQIWRKSNYAFAFYGSFLQVCKKKKIKRRKWATFWRPIFQELLTRFTSDLVCVLSWYAGTCTANLVLFGQETTELWTCVKSYFVLHVNILTLCAHTLFSWAARHTNVCLDISQFVLCNTQTIDQRINVHAIL